MDFDFSGQEQHAMLHVGKAPDGGDEWHCPTCGHRIVIHWPPDYQRIVLVEGDPLAAHSGATGGLKMNALELRPAEEDPGETLRLEQWQGWLDQADFESWWNKDID